MCFSAGASFGAAVMLTAVGIAAMKKVESRRLMPFAAIPLLFATQQFAEGSIWLSSTNSIPPGFQQPAVYVFLIFAQVIWPAWVPISIWLIEPRGKRRAILLALAAAGVILTLYNTFCLINYPVWADAADRHIVYHRSFPQMGVHISSIAYILATIFPPLISKINKMFVLGFAILFSFLITVMMYQEFLISVWCFFAAVISVIVLFLVRTTQEQKDDTKQSI